MVGAIPEFKLLRVRLSFRSASDFSQLERAIDMLLANPAVEFASFVFPSEATMLPVPSGDAAGTDWYWEPTSIDAVGVGDNWGLELARVPQAWNLNDAVRQRSGEPRPGTSSCKLRRQTAGLSLRVGGSSASENPALS